MKKSIFLVAASMIFMMSCNKSEKQTGGDNAIEFRTTINKSRASQTTNVNQIRSFFVHAEIAGKNNFEFLNAAAYKDAAWTYSPKKYWPTNGDKVNFYAYAPIKDVNMTTGVAINAAGVVTFGYTVPIAQNVVNTATDLIVASVLAQDKTNTPVNFGFTHALSAATFSAKNENAAISELTYIISKIELTNLENVGTYTYGVGWAAPLAANQTKNYVAGVPASGVAVLPVGGAGNAVKLLSANDVMMVLPQSVHTNSAVKITFSLKDSEGTFIFKDATREFNLSAAATPFTTLVPSKLYNFGFIFADASTDPNLVPITFDVTSLSSWDEVDTDVAP